MNRRQFLSSVGGAASITEWDRVYRSELSQASVPDKVGMRIPPRISSRLVGQMS